MNQTLSETISNLRQTLISQLAAGQGAGDLPAQIVKAEAEQAILESLAGDVNALAKQQERNEAAILKTHKQAAKLRHEAADTILKAGDTFQGMIGELDALLARHRALVGVLAANGGGVGFYDIQNRCLFLKTHLQAIVGHIEFYKIKEWGDSIKP